MRVFNWLGRSSDQFQQPRMSGPLVVGLSGVTNGGKTTLASALAATLREDGRTVVCIAQDDHFRPIEEVWSLFVCFIQNRRFALLHKLCFFVTILSFGARPPPPNPNAKNSTQGSYNFRKKIGYFRPQAQTPSKMLRFRVAPPPPLRFCRHWVCCFTKLAFCHHLSFAGGASPAPGPPELGHPLRHQLPVPSPAGPRRHRSLRREHRGHPRRFPL